MSPQGQLELKLSNIRSGIIFIDYRKHLLEPFDAKTTKNRMRNIDSLDAVELIMAMEEEFKFEILDEDAEKFITVQDTVSYTEKIMQVKIRHLSFYG